MWSTSNLFRSCNLKRLSIWKWNVTKYDIVHVDNTLVSQFKKKHPPGDSAVIQRRALSLVFLIFLLVILFFYDCSLVLQWNNLLIRLINIYIHYWAQNSTGYPGLVWSYLNNVEFIIALRPKTRPSKRRISAGYPVGLWGLSKSEISESPAWYYLSNRCGQCYKGVTDLSRDGLEEQLGILEVSDEVGYRDALH